MPPSGGTLMVRKKGLIVYQKTCEVSLLGRLD